MPTVSTRRIAASRAYNARHIHNEIAEAIRAGQFGDGVLPDEQLIARRYGVSRNVVREALDELRKEGVVARIAGRGTFVLPSRVQQPLHALRGLQEILGDHLVYEAIDAVTIPAPPGLAATLGLDPGDEVYYLERIGYIDGVCVIAASTYIPVAVIPGLMKQGVPKLRKQLDEAGKAPASADLELSAVAADDAVAGLFGVPVGHPLLFFRRVMYGAGGDPVEVTFTHYQSSSIALVSHQTRASDEEAR